MSEAMARALGASGTLTVTIAGKECTVRPLGMKELAEVERDCAERWKRAYLKTYADTADMRPDGKGWELFERKVDEVAKWDAEDLPPKWVNDPDRIVLTPVLKARLAELLGIEGEEKTDAKWRRLASVVLDQGMLTEKEYFELTGEKPPAKQRIGYVNWWINSDYDGMLTFTWTCFRHCGVTREQVADAMRGRPSLLMEVTQEIARLSAPQSGNG